MTRKNRQLGMTLMEVVISLVFIAVVVVLYGAAMNTVTLSKKQRYENYAYHIANKQMEELRLTPFNSLPANGSIADPMLSNIPSGSGSFVVQDHAGYAGLKEIIVTVSWNDGSVKQVVIKTVAGLGGLNP